MPARLSPLRPRGSLRRWGSLVEAVVRHYYHGPPTRLFRARARTELGPVDFGTLLSDSLSRSKSRVALSSARSRSNSVPAISTANAVMARLRALFLRVASGRDFMSLLWHYGMTYHAGWHGFSASWRKSRNSRRCEFPEPSSAPDTPVRRPTPMNRPGRSFE